MSMSLDPYDSSVTSAASACRRGGDVFDFEYKLNMLIVESTAAMPDAHH